MEDQLDSVLGKESKNMMAREWEGEGELAQFGSWR